MPGHSVHVDLNPRYRGAWHAQTREAQQAREVRRERIWLVGIVSLLIATLVYAGRADFDSGAMVMLAAGGLGASLAGTHPMALWSLWNSDRIGRRRADRGAILVFLALGAGLALAGAGRESLLRQARSDCRDSLRKLASGSAGAVVLAREPASGVRGWLIYDRRPRRCADIIRMGDAL